MEDPEVPTEHLHEHINEEAGDGRDPWSMYLAISTALMAVFAALGSLFAGHHSNEALISKLQANDQWAYYQAKGTKYEITHGVFQILQGIKGVNIDSASLAQMDDKQARYKSEQKEITEKANEAEKESEEHLKKHVTLARCVTLFQISIAISAISILTRRRFLWYFSLVLSAGGLYLFIMGMI